MKVAIYYEDGAKQLALTPETDFDKEALKGIGEGGSELLGVFRGEFYACQGGWDRHRGGSEESLMLKFGKPKP